MKRVKYIIVIALIFLFAARNIAGCQSWTKQYIKRTWKTHSITFSSGFFYGVGETLKDHHFKSVFRDVPETSFFGSQSWERKYKDYPTNQNAAFPLSKTSLVFLTDGYHLSRFLHRGTLTFNLVIIYEKPKVKKWEKWLDLGISFIVFSAGFHLENLLLEPY